MANIFEIGNELQLIFNELEENGGELTEELAEKLEITQQNFEDKIEAYCQVLTMYNSDINCCKEEKDRINNIQKVKKNVVDRIKNKLLEAVTLFGETGKSGNKVINLPTHKLYTKNTTSVIENESRKGKLAYYLISYIKELQSQSILELGEEIDINGLLAAINAIAKADYETPDEFGNPPVEEYVPFTLADLQVVELYINDCTTLYNLITSRSELGYLIASEKLSYMDTGVVKDIAKAILQDDSDRLTVGKLNTSTSVVIK